MQAIKKSLGFKVKPVPKKVIYVPVTNLNFENKDKLEQKLETIKKKDKVADALLVGINVGAGGNPKYGGMVASDLMGKIL